MTEFNPIFAALAGLTYWIRLQVVTFIMGRSFYAREQDSLGTYVEDLDILASLTDFTTFSSIGNGPVFGCYADFGF